jgi:hypothetical protein
MLIWIAFHWEDIVVNSLRLVLLFSVAAGILAGQTTMGTITGLVTDSTGSVIPSAAISARNVDTGVVASTISSSTGNYVIPSLQVGTYEVSVTVAGFKSWKRGAIAVKSGDNIRVDVPLEVGSTSERIEVTAEAPSLKTESTEVSTVMENKLVNDLPLAVAGIGGGMRNAFQIMMMMPQVKSNNGEGAWDDLQVGGGQQHDWNVSVDGLSVEMGWRNHVGYMNRLTPALDAIEEFRIDTAAFKAEDSRASGGNISITTKSGTNELHGSLFDFYQSQRLNAKTTSLAARRPCSTATITGRQWAGRSSFRSFTTGATSRISSFRTKVTGFRRPPASAS